jgi:SAM-dependent methyltransferase
MSDKCPLTGLPGRKLRCRLPDELADCYHTYFGHALPEDLVSRYFKPIQEYENSTSGLRWFSPARLAEQDFYEYLALTYRWYYNHETWDKKFALGLLQQFGAKGVTDVGCGNGFFLNMARALGISGIGVDMNPEGVAKARSDGHQVYLATELPEDLQFPPTFCLFQTLEHVADPLRFVQTYIQSSNCDRLIISTPCFESFFGYSTDPLMWPPHHFTIWSARSLKTLANLLGFKVTHIHYQPTTFDLFTGSWFREPDDRLPLGPLRLSRSPAASRLRYVYAKYFLGRLFQRDWACRHHSILAVLER